MDQHDDGVVGMLRVFNPNCRKPRQGWWMGFSGNISQRTPTRHSKEFELNLLFRFAANEEVEASNSHLTGNFLNIYCFFTSGDKLFS
jgi:hypothetical protein